MATIEPVAQVRFPLMDDVNEELEFDMRKEGWKFERNVESGEEDLILALYDFGTKTYYDALYGLSDGRLLARSEQLPGKPVGQLIAERLMHNPGLVPPEFHHTIVFTGTIWLNEHGNQRVPVVRPPFFTADWSMEFRGFTYGSFTNFYEGDMVVRILTPDESRTG